MSATIVQPQGARGEAEAADRVLHQMHGAGARLDRQFPHPFHPSLAARQQRDPSALLESCLYEELRSDWRLRRRDVEGLRGRGLAALLEAAVPRDRSSGRGEPLIHRVLHIVVPHDGERGGQAHGTGVECGFLMGSPTPIVELENRMEVAARPPFLVIAGGVVGEEDDVARRVTRLLRGDRPHRQQGEQAGDTARPFRPRAQAAGRPRFCFTRFLTYTVVPGGPLPTGVMPSLVAMARAPSLPSPMQAMTRSSLAVSNAHAMASLHASFARPRPCASDLKAQSSSKSLAPSACERTSPATPTLA